MRGHDEHSNEDGTRLMTLRVRAHDRRRLVRLCECAHVGPSCQQSKLWASTNDVTEATRGHHGRPSRLRLELGGGRRSRVGGLRASTKTARANGCTAQGLNLHDPQRVRLQSSKGSNVECGQKRLGSFVRANLRTFSRAAQPLKPWSGRALPRATSLRPHEDVKVVLRIFVCGGKRGWFASVNEGDGVCK